MKKGTAILLGCLGLVMAGTAAGSLTYALNSDFRAKVDDVIAGSKAKKVDWSKIDYDWNYTVLKTDNTTKTATIIYTSDDKTEYVKIPKTILFNHVDYTVSSFSFNSGYQGWGAMNVNHYVKAVLIPESVTEISSYCFYNCTSLLEVEIPDSVTSIGAYSFNNCTSLIEADLPDSIVDIKEGAFKYCTSLEKIVLRDGLAGIGSAAFENCISLKNLIIPDSVTSLGNMAFSQCESLKNVSIPKGLTALSSSFEGCTSLTEINIPGSVKNIIGSFKDCTSLKKVSFGNGVETIGQDSFKNCVSLMGIDFPDSITSIGIQAFDRCVSLVNVEIPNSVTNIASNAFYGISKNAFFINHCTKPKMGESVVASFVPVYFDAYKADVDWATLATERTEDDKKVYYKGEWEMKDGKPVLTGNDADVKAVSTAASSSAGA